MAPVDHSSVVPPPVSGDRPLKRVVSMTGAYGLRNYTIKDLRDLKGVRQLVETNTGIAGGRGRGRRGGDRYY